MELKENENPTPEQLEKLKADKETLKFVHLKQAKELAIELKLEEEIERINKRFMRRNEYKRRKEQTKLRNKRRQQENQLRYKLTKKMMNTVANGIDLNEKINLSQLQDSSDSEDEIDGFSKNKNHKIRKKSSDMTEHEKILYEYKQNDKLRLKELEDTVLKKVFSLAEESGNGHVTPFHMMHVLKKNSLVQEYISSVPALSSLISDSLYVEEFLLMDSNMDGKISLEEFLMFMSIIKDVQRHSKKVKQALSRSGIGITHSEYTKWEKDIQNKLMSSSGQPMGQNSESEDSLRKGILRRKASLGLLKSSALRKMNEIYRNISVKERKTEEWEQGHYHRIIQMGPDQKSFCCICRRRRWEIQKIERDTKEDALRKSWGEILANRLKEAEADLVIKLEKEIEVKKSEKKLRLKMGRRDAVLMEEQDINQVVKLTETKKVNKFNLFRSINNRNNKKYEIENKIEINEPKMDTESKSNNIIINEPQNEAKEISKTKEFNKSSNKKIEKAKGKVSKRTEVLNISTDRPELPLFAQSQEKSIIWNLLHDCIDFVEMIHKAIPLDEIEKIKTEKASRTAHVRRVNNDSHDKKKKKNRSTKHSRKLQERLVDKLTTERKLIEQEEIERTTMYHEDERIRWSVELGKRLIERPLLRIQEAGHRDYLNLMDHFVEVNSFFRRLQYERTMKSGRFRMLLHVNDASHGTSYILQTVPYNFAFHPTPTNKKKTKDTCLEYVHNSLKILKQIQSPNLIRIYEYDTYAYQTFATNGVTVDDIPIVVVVMQFIPTGRLIDYIRVNRVIMEEKHVLEILLQVSAGLSMLHSRKIHHGNINIGNLYIASNSNILIGGYQMLKDPRNPFDISPDSSESILDTTTSPERLESKHNESIEVLMAGDIWALGCIGYTLATGSNKPLYGLHINKILQNIPLRFGQTFRSFLRMCLQKNPKQRALASKIFDFITLSTATTVSQTLQVEKLSLSQPLQTSNSICRQRTMKKYQQLPPIKDE